MAVAAIALAFAWLSFAGALWQFYAGAFVMGLGIGMLLFYLIMAMAFLLNFGMYLYFMIPSYLNGMEIAVAMPLIGSLALSAAMAGQTASKLVFGFVGDKHPHACTIVGVALGIVGVVLLAAGIQNAAVIFAAALAFGAYYGVTNVMSPIITR